MLWGTVPSSALGGMFPFQMNIPFQRIKHTSWEKDAAVIFSGRVKKDHINDPGENNTKSCPFLKPEDLPQAGNKCFCAECSHPSWHLWVFLSAAGRAGKKLGIVLFSREMQGAMSSS